MRTRNLNAEIVGLRLGLSAPWTPAELERMKMQTDPQPAVPAIPLVRIPEVPATAASTAAR